MPCLSYPRPHYRNFEGLFNESRCIKLTKPGADSKSESEKSDEGIDNSTGENDESKDNEDHEHLTPAADGIKSTTHLDHEAIDNIDNEETEEDHDDDNSETETNDHNEDNVNETDKAPLKEPLSITDIDDKSMSITLEHNIDCQVVQERLESDGATGLDKDKLKLKIPDSGIEDGEVPETPKEYMDDGEEVRERRPGFQDLGNCKRFWKASQLIGTRKLHALLWILHDLIVTFNPVTAVTRSCQPLVYIPLVFQVHAPISTRSSLLINYKVWSFYLIM